MSCIELDGKSLTIEKLVAVACKGARVAPLSETVKQNMRPSRDWIRDIEDKFLKLAGLNEA